MPRNQLRVVPAVLDKPPARGAALSESVKYWIRPDLVNRIAEGKIGAFYQSTLTTIRPTEVDVRTPSGLQTLPAEFVYALTGYQPDYSLLTALGVPLDEADAAAPPAFDVAPQVAVDRQLPPLTRV